MGSDWKQETEAVLTREDWGALRELARGGVSRIVRYLVTRLYSGEETEKQRAVRALGALAADTSILDSRRATDLMRRFVWALNDESGAVPYGVPEAMGEVLAVRPDLQPAFLPILCALLTENDLRQTGPIERGAIWAVGRVGPAAMRKAPEVVAALRDAASRHPDPQTREIAVRSLAAVTGGPES